MYGINNLVIFAFLFLGHFDQDIMESSIRDTIPLMEYQKHPFFNKDYFTKMDADKILGEPGTLSDSLSLIKKDTLEIRKTYTANTKDIKTGKTGNIYFIIEEYAELEAAKHAYNQIKVSNENHAGVKTLQGVGDEAYFHSDGNFYFALVRKQKLMFRMKVNKVTSHSSLEGFNEVTKKIADGL